ncbi:MAG: glycoside hydrolase family 16 protein [Porphyromonas sp.]|nr:glycoside hydrolase family 16 protein [Porphyromonas sp.]
MRKSKKILLPVLALLLVVATGCQQCKTTTTADRPADLRWKLAWAEEFDGNELDDTVWSKAPRSNADWSSKMSDAEELFELRDGTLVLKVLENTFQPNDSLPFLTGGVWSKGKKSFKMGRIDIKARFDSGQGFWPALWMLGEGKDWPKGGELDIMEHLNHDNFVYQTVHTPYTLSGMKSSPSNHGIAVIDSSEFNIYSVEVHDDRIVYLVNDQVAFTYPRLPHVDKEEQFPYTDLDFYVILSAQHGGDWVGEPNLEVLPLELQIDFVRYYQYE